MTETKRGGTGRENVSVAAGAAPAPRKVRVREWATFRDGRLWTFFPSEERARQCAHDGDRVVELTGEYEEPGGEKAGITQAERAQRTSEHHSTGMREALEITRMQLAVDMAGKNALSNEKHLSIVNAALSSTGDERREAIEECAKIADYYSAHSATARSIRKAIRSLLHSDGGEKP